MRIRNARETDLPGLVEIGKKFYTLNPFRHTAELDNFSLRRTLLDVLRHHVLLVVLDDDKLVGAAGVYIAPLYWHFGKLQAQELFWWIDQEYRGTKAGKQLFIWLENACRAKGVNYLCMAALQESSPEAVGAIYERAGYHKIEINYMKELQ